MKGLVKKTASGTVFLLVKHGSLCEESKVAREGFEPVKVKNPRTEEEVTKYINRYSGVEGLINSIEFRDTGEQYEQRFTSWRITMDADGTPVVLELPFQSRFSSRFMKLAENIDYSRPVEFRAWHDTREDKTAFYVAQEEQAVKQRYTRDTPNGCPEPTQNRMGKWNYDLQTEFLYDRMMNTVIPQVEAAKAKREFSALPQEARTGEPDFDRSEPEYTDDDSSGAPF